MALSPNMKRALRRIADILGAYARIQGWWPLDFRLYVRANETWGHINVILVAHQFEGRDGFKSYQSIMKYLRTRLSDDPQLFAAIGLVLRTFEQVEQGGLYAIGHDYLAVRPRDLNKLTIREVAGLLNRYARDHGYGDQDFHVLYKAMPDRVLIRFLISGSPGHAADEPGPSVGEYVRSRLSDEPEILNTLDLEVMNEANQETFRQLVESEFKDFWASSRVGFSTS